MDELGNQVGVVQTGQALMMARQRGLDLVEVAANAQPPVCRIMDFGKYKYELAKKERQSKKHQVGGKVKEVKFHANVDEHDFQTKMRHMREFLAEGHRVKTSLMFRGREQAHQEIGYQVMRRVAKEISDVGNTERAPEMMGRTLYMMVSPRPSAVRPKAAPPPPPAAGAAPASGPG